MNLTKKQVEYRLKALPKLLEQEIKAGTKLHATNFQKVLDDGLRKGNLVEPKLSSLTLKIRKNMKDNSIPESPLVGHNGLINSLEIVKEKNIWICRPNNKFSTSRYSTNKKRISWKRLWLIHELGTKLYDTSARQQWFFKNILGINPSPRKLQIPARYPWKKAINRYTRQQYRKETNKELYKRIKGLILK